MRILLPLVMSLFFVCFLGCKENEPVKAVEKPFAPTHDGHLIKFHRDLPGANTKVGDLAKYHIRHRNGNSVTFSSRKAKSEPFKYLVPSMNLGVKIPPIIVGLLQMSPGDSVTLRIDLTDAKFTEPGYENAKFKDIDISLIGIEKSIDPVVYNAKQRVVEPNEFNQEIDYNSSTKELSGKKENQYTADELWQTVMDKKLKELLYDLGNQYRSGELNNSLLRLPSGLQYMVIEPGTNKKFGFSKNVWLKYYGSNIEGRPFDKKYIKDKVEEIEIGSGQIIKGLEEGIKQLNEGGSGIFFIPPDLAFGSKGTYRVEPNAQFVVYYAKVERFY